MIAIMKVLLRSVILSDKRSFSWNAMCIQVRAIIDFFIGDARIPLVIVSIHSLFRSVRGLSVRCVKGSYVKPTRATIDCFIGDARIPLIIVSIHSLFPTVIGVSVGCVKGSYVKPTRRTPSRYIVASSVWSIVLSHIRFDVSPLKGGIIR